MTHRRSRSAGGLPPEATHDRRDALARFAAQLRAERAGLDEFSRARMERELVQTWRTRPARAMAFGERRRRNLWTQSVIPIAVSMTALVGAVVALQASKSAGPASRESVAVFAVHLPGGGVQRGVASEGQLLRSGKHGSLEVAIGRSRIDAERSTEFRFDRLDAGGVELTVKKGRVELSFEPRQKGEQVMRIHTRAAHVKVIGTRFSVAVDGRGDTEVAVTEGIVEVTPRRGGGVRRLRAGERMQVMADPGDASERALRRALSERVVRSGRADSAAVEDDEAADDEAADDEAADDRAPAARPVGRAETKDPRAVGLGVPAGAATGVMRASTDGDSSRRPADVADELERSHGLLRAGRHGPARRVLQGLVQGGHAAAHERAEAWTLLAESFTAQGQVPKAKHAYEMASRSAPRHAVGHNATFALARLLERYTQDQDGAVHAYRRYLEEVPGGALAGQARRGLCRLGDAAACE